MPLFSYKAVRDDGSTVIDQLNAATVAEVRETLEDRGYLVLDVRKKGLLASRRGASAKEFLILQRICDRRLRTRSCARDWMVKRAIAILIRCRTDEFSACSQRLGKENEDRIVRFMIRGVPPLIIEIDIEPVIQPEAATHADEHGICAGRRYGQAVS